MCIINYNIVTYYTSINIYITIIYVLLIIINIYLI